MNGSINATNDINGDSGVGIYINGNIQHENNSPIINLSNTVNINSTGVGIYAAGYATYNINGAYIKGKESSLGIKSGIFNIINGTFIADGPDKTPTSGNNNGINPSGSTIQIESNNGYKGNIELNIKDGIFKSENSHILYEYTINNTNTKIKNINISGGTFTSTKPNFSLSQSLKETHPKFISGGTFSTNPTTFLKKGYTASQNKDSYYEIISNTMKEINTQNNNKNNIFKKIIILLITTIIGITIYINRKKIINIIKPNLY